MIHKQMFMLNISCYIMLFMHSGDPILFRFENWHWRTDFENRSTAQLLFQSYRLVFLSLAAFKINLFSYMYFSCLHRDWYHSDCLQDASYTRDKIKPITTFLLLESQVLGRAKRPNPFNRSRPAKKNEPSVSSISWLRDLRGPPGKSTSVPFHFFKGRNVEMGLLN